MAKYWTNNLGNRKSIRDFEFEFNLEYNINQNEFYFEVDGPHNWDNFVDDNLTGIWKFEPILPIGKDAIIKVSENINMELTPPMEIPELAKELGVKNFFLFPCLNGKSGNFKDIEAAFIIGKLHDWENKSQISFHSTGNTARAYREYSISANLKSVAFFPLECVNKFIGASENNENKLFAYNGSFKDISSFAKKWAEKNEYLHLSPLRWKIEGKVPLGYHILHSVPNTTHIVQTIAGGYGPIGIYEAILRLKKWKLVSHLPKFELFQISDSDTISSLINQKKELLEADLKIQHNSFEPTLQSTNPLTTYNIVKNIILKTKSRIATVDYKDVLRYSENFLSICENYGINLSFIDEKSPFISWAGLMNNAARKLYKGNEVVSFILTGSKKRTGKIPNIDWLINPAIIN